MSNARTIFVSHVHEDADFARPLKEWLDETFLGAVNSFVSSSPTSLPPGTDWPAQLKSALQESAVSLLLLSPVSVTRHWVHFEAGAAYVRGIPVVPLCIAGLSVSDLKPPLSFLQAIQLDDPGELQKLLAVVASTVGLRTPRTHHPLALPSRVANSPMGQPPLRPLRGADSVQVTTTTSDARRFLKEQDPATIKRLGELFLVTWIRRENPVSGLKGLQPAGPAEYRFCEAFYHR